MHFKIVTPYWWFWRCICLCYWNEMSCCPNRIWVVTEPHPDPHGSMFPIIVHSTEARGTKVPGIHLWLICCSGLVRQPVYFKIRLQQNEDGEESSHRVDNLPLALHLTRHLCHDTFPFNWQNWRCFVICTIWLPICC